MTQASTPTDADPRVAAFCSPERLPGLFHAIAYRSDIWKADPFDVETIHEEARAAFQRLVRRAASPSGAPGGRILLLLGEAGSGKTHLLRAFRNWTHAQRRGYYGYMQMTSGTGHYGRYVLNNLIDSLDQPYDETAGETSALMRLSTAIAESPRGLSLDRLEHVRGAELDHGCLAKLIDALADQVVMDDRFNTVDIDLVRALLYLQCDDPRIKSRVLKYLRCEDLSDADRRVLGGIVPRSYDEAPQRLVQRLAEIMAALESAPLVLCVDQLEDIYNLDDASTRFRRATATLCDLASRIPSLVVVISCLEDFYQELRRFLTSPIVDRIEKDPPPIRLRGPRDEPEIVRIVSRRLRVLYDASDTPFLEDDPTFPFPLDFLRKFVGQRTRDVLERCQEYRECSITLGRLAPIDGPPILPPSPPPTDTAGLEQAWNDFRAAFVGEVPDGEDDLAALLAGAIRGCSRELETGHRFAAEANGRHVTVECRSPDTAAAWIVVGVCNRSAQGGALGKQIQELERLAGSNTPVVVRSTEFPSNPKTQIAKQLGTLIARGGRRAVVEDSDWRTMLALPRFLEARGQGPAVDSWLVQGKPLTGLKSLRAILGLDNLGAPRPRLVAPHRDPLPDPATDEVANVQTQDGPPAAPEVEAGPIAVGTTLDRAKEPVVLEPGELTRHAAFLGGTGSGKTTLALNVVEQLLLRGIPAILVDRKGDLCGYARAEAWTRPIESDELAARRDRLRGRVDVAVYTPGNPLGRPLSISVVPVGLGELGSFERGQVARYAASALAGMMNYSGKGTDQARQAILTRAIDLLAQLERGRTVGLSDLIDFIAEQDPVLVNAVGRLDTKLFERLVQDLETLRLARGAFLAAEGEPLDVEALLGLGRHARPRKTRLSVVSTKFLGQTQDVQFWVSQLLVALGRWASRAPSPALQAVVLVDEADLYLPALRQPPTKEPMEDLLRRARSAGLGLLLATQSPGDFDYKSRDNLRAWFVGRVKEPTALAKLKPMLAECRWDAGETLPVQEPGQFHLIRDGSVVRLLAAPCAVPAEQLPEDEILALARTTCGLARPH